MLTLLTLLACAQDPDTARVTLDLKDVSLGKALDAVRAQTKVPIELDEEVKKRIDLDNATMDVKITDLVLRGALQLLFGPAGLQVDVVDKKKIRISVPK